MQQACPPEFLRDTSRERLCSFKRRAMQTELPASADSGPAARTKPRGALALLAVAAGLAVANLYYAQPLAAMMADSLRVSAGAIGLSLMACQLGYALGMLVLVPLGDGRERRSLMVRTALATSLSALLVAASPSYPLLVAASGLLGFCSSLPQMTVPFAVALVDREARGAAIGVVMSGLLAGILLSRTASGSFAAAIGWRGTFVGAAVLMLLLALVLRGGLDAQYPPEPLPWRSIVLSLPGVLRGQPLLAKHALLGALGFASFSAFWSTLSFQLAELGEGARTAGLFGVLGVSGIAAAALVGRYADRLGATRLNASALVLLAISFVLSGFWQRSLFGLAAGAVLLDIGMQSNHLTNQTVIFGLAPALRNRINAIYMVCFFIGGAVGTAAASLAWEMARWNGVCFVGTGFSICALVPVALWKPSRAA
ncbi:MAG TPA: MFS transporter [Polyangiaceae bacterium]|nr:MFS transporter [Polyangiaceae bacterium]